MFGQKNFKISKLGYASFNHESFLLMLQHKTRESGFPRNWYQTADEGSKEVKPGDARIPQVTREVCVQEVAREAAGKPAQAVVEVAKTCC